VDVDGEDVAERSLEPLESFDFADRAMDRILLVSGSASGALRPNTGVDAEVDGENSLDSPVPFVFAREGEEDAADTGERISGVDERVWTSVLSAGSFRGVGNCDGLGVDGLLYTSAGWKVLVVAKGTKPLVWRRNDS